MSACHSALYETEFLNLGIDAAISLWVKPSFESIPIFIRSRSGWTICMRLNNFLQPLHLKVPLAFSLTLWNEHIWLNYTYSHGELFPHAV